MAHLLTWPKRRKLTTVGGRTETAVILPGRLVIWHDEDHATIYDDADELRAFAMQVYAAAIELDLDARYPPGRGRAGAKAARRRAARSRMEAVA